MSLIEIMVVLAIISLIVGGVAFVALPRLQKAKIDTAKNECRVIQTVVETWKMDHAGGDCPKLEDLKNDKLLKSDISGNDPWTKPYRIVCAGDEISVGSNGPDQKEGSEDDIWAGTKPVAK